MSDFLSRLLREVSEAEFSLKIAVAWIRGEILENIVKALKPDVKLEVVLRAGERKDLEISDYRTFKAVRDFGGGALNFQKDRYWTVV